MMEIRPGLGRIENSGIIKKEKSNGYSFTWKGRKLWFEAEKLVRLSTYLMGKGGCQRMGISKPESVL